VKLPSLDTSATAAWRPALRALAERRSLILCYHGVAPSRASEDPEFLRVDPARFRAEVEMLLEAGFEFMTVADLAARAAGAPPPPGLAALSFDDGMDDNHAVVMPLLAEYGIPATVYVTTGMIGQPNPWISESARMMTREELLELHAAGFELGAHTVTHPDMSQLGREACAREIGESRALLEELTGTPVRTFAYPFCKYGPEALAAVEEAGFDAAVTCQGRGSWARYEMKRALITGKDGLPSFVLKAWDAYGPLFHSPPGRAVRAGTRTARRQVRALRERS
jgi:peptidoglycan/xylan/chitin deacetylase (PgdA/CDA1 family)